MKETLKRIIPRRVLRLAREPRAEIAEVRLYLERHALASIGHCRERPRGRILAYHSLGQHEYGVNDVSPTRFRRHIELALDAGYRFVPPADIARTGGQPKDLAISFDDGLKSVLTAAAPLLAEHRIPYVVFAVSNWSEMKHPWCREQVMGWRELEMLMNEGAEIGSHSASHPDFAQISHQQAVDELAGSRDVIRRRLGFTPTSFAIPFGQSGNWPQACQQAARDAGYGIVYAQAEDTRPAGTVARTFVTKYDSDRIFRAALDGKYDRWEEWL